jgi:hypothetical protein
VPEQPPAESAPAGEQAPVLEEPAPEESPPVEAPAPEEPVAEEPVPTAEDPPVVEEPPAAETPTAPAPTQPVAGPAPEPLSGGGADAEQEQAGPPEESSPSVAAPIAVVYASVAVAVPDGTSAPAVGLGGGVPPGGAAGVRFADSLVNFPAAGGVERPASAEGRALEASVSNDRVGSPVPRITIGHGEPQPSTAPVQTRSSALDHDAGGPGMGGAGSAAASASGSAGGSSAGLVLLVAALGLLAPALAWLLRGGASVMRDLAVVAPIERPPFLGSV